MDLQALKRDFDENGYLHIKGFMDVAEVETWAAEWDRFVKEVVPTLPRNRAMFEDYDDPTTLKQVDTVEKFDPAFKSLLLDARFIELSGVLLEDTIIPDHIEAFIKAPQRGTPTPAHQDGYYFGLTPNEALTVWMPIGDIAANAGALCYIKGSHHGGIHPHGASGVLGFSQGIQVDYQSLGEEVVCVVEKGDILVHHSRTIHYAAGNQSNQWRRSLGMVYYAERAKEDKEFLSRYYANVREQQAALGVV